MSPILVRPVREQLEHDRIIRLLQAKFRRRFEVGINPGTEQLAAVNSGGSPIYPDLVLQSQERGRRLQGVVEVETGESVNHLEALAQWANLARLKADFHLYVPSGMVDVARRLSEDNQISVNEIWSYHTVGDEVRFTLVHRGRETSNRMTPPASRPTPKPVSRSVKSAVRVAKPVQLAKATVKSKKTSKPSSRSAKTVKKAARPKKRK